MTSSGQNPRCEVLLQLQSELDALGVAVRKANDILYMTAESPDTLRRRRNSIKRWNEIYADAIQRLHNHARDHGCNVQEAGA